MERGGRGALLARLALAAAFLVGPARAWAASADAAPRPSEYAVKAAFLYNFAKFVEWPSPKAEAPFVVAVLGHDPFGPLLEQTFAGKAVMNRKLVVRRADVVRDVEGADIVFVAASENARLDAILGALDGTPTLTVADMEDFVGRGGMIGFRLQDEVVRFDVNLDRVAKAQLKMSSQLVRVARRVIPTAGS